MIPLLVNHSCHSEANRRSAMQEQSEPDDADWEETGDAAPEGSQETAPAPAPALGPQDVEAALHVKDAGMMLVSTVAPDFTWQSGNADIALRWAADMVLSQIG